MATRLAEKDADLAILDAPCGAAGLAFDPYRMSPFLEKAGLIDDQDSIVVAEVAYDVAVQIVADGPRPLRAP